MSGVHWLIISAPYLPPTGLAAERGLHDFRPGLRGLSEAAEAEEEEAAAAATTVGAADDDAAGGKRRRAGANGESSASSIPLRLALALGDVRRGLAQDREEGRQQQQQEAQRRRRRRRKRWVPCLLISFQFDGLLVQSLLI